ncbi:MAG: cell division protein FtsZ [Deltaproteobacteria bacterium]|jgi:cell division protein FtsZ|nr:cell division protein FtsZ [Deltaproteobacteria bacterium]
MEDDFEFVRPDAGLADDGELPSSGPAAAGHSITVFGIGGCGNNTVNHMIRKCGINGIKYVAANSDQQDLKNSLAPCKILLGPKSTRSKGCGGRPEKGRLATEEVMDEIRRELAGTELLFIAAGMGGGTGSGGAPVVAQAMGALDEPPLIVSVITTPFSWEVRRQKISDRVVGDLTASSNSIITIANTNVETQLPKGATLDEAFEAANEVLQDAVAGIIELLVMEGEINLDFADVETVLSCHGPALMGFGEASGDSRAKKALQNAVTCPLMTDHSIRGAKMLIVNVVTDTIFGLDEYREIMTDAAKAIDPEGEVFGGWAKDPALDETGSIRVTIIATGLYNDDAWAAPVPETGSEEEVVLDLSALNEEDAEPAMRPEPEPPRRGELHAPRQLAPRPAPHLARVPQPNPFGVQQGPPRAVAVREPSAGVLPPPGRSRRQGSAYQVPPAHAPNTKYESHGGVDPVNKDSKFYDTPPFFRNKAN